MAGRRATYLVPEFLCRIGSTETSLVDVGDPYVYFANLLDRIVAEARPIDRRSGLRATNHVYQSFPRTFASLNGRIGTALTQIAFLPFLRDRLGVDVFVCLPPSRIGRTNRKGRRGSPFAVTDPFDIDPSMGDPLLSTIPPLVQYRALMQACDILGIRSGSIVPMATLAMDSPLFAALPSLGCWWHAEPGELVHCGPTTHGLSRQPDHSAPGIDTNVVPRFVPAPDPAALMTAEGPAGSYYVVPPSAAGDTPVTLANAFPDVLAGDATTYTWGDVATVRYGPGLVPAPAGRPRSAATGSRQPAWDLMPAILAWRYHELGERVFLIDVSPSVPPKLLSRARAVAGAWKPDLAERLGQLGAGRLAPDEVGRLVSDVRDARVRGARCPVEDLTIVGEELWDFELPDERFDAVCGPLAYCVSAHTWNIPVLASSLLHHLRVIEDRQADSPYLAGVANHDTMPPVPWASGLLRMIYHFLPGAVPLTFSGTEWGARVVTNKEFGFDSTQELLHLRERLGDDVLALFNDVPIEWREVAPGDHQVGLISSLAAIHERLGSLSGWGFEVHVPEPEIAPYCLGYVRSAADRHLVVLANWSAMPVVITWSAPSARVVLCVPSDGAPAYAISGGPVALPARSAIVAVTVPEPPDEPEAPPAA